jgi:hypothetical protein
MPYSTLSLISIYIRFQTSIPGTCTVMIKIIQFVANYMAVSCSEESLGCACMAVNMSNY